MRRDHASGGDPCQEGDNAGRIAAFPLILCRISPESFQQAPAPSESRRSFFRALYMRVLGGILPDGVGSLKEFGFFHSALVTHQLDMGFDIFRVLSNLSCHVYR